MLPAGGGRLVITRSETARNVSLGFEAVALLVAFVLALPGTRSPVPALASAGSARTPMPSPRPGGGENAPRARGRPAASGGRK